MWTAILIGTFYFRLGQPDQVSGDLRLLEVVADHAFLFSEMVPQNLERSPAILSPSTIFSEVDFQL
jgi:hypothetical protein